MSEFITSFVRVKERGIRNGTNRERRGGGGGEGGREREIDRVGGDIREGERREGNRRRREGEREKVKGG